LALSSATGITPLIDIESTQFNRARFLALEAPHGHRSWDRALTAYRTGVLILLVFLALLPPAAPAGAQAPHDITFDLRLDSSQPQGASGLVFGWMRWQGFSAGTPSRNRITKEDCPPNALGFPAPVSLNMTLHLGDAAPSFEGRVEAYENRRWDEAGGPGFSQTTVEAKISGDVAASSDGTTWELSGRAELKVTHDEQTLCEPKPLLRTDNVEGTVKGRIDPASGSSRPSIRLAVGTGDAELVRSLAVGDDPAQRLASQIKSEEPPPPWMVELICRDVALPVAVPLPGEPGAAPGAVSAPAAGPDTGSETAAEKAGQQITVWVNGQDTAQVGDVVELAAVLNQGEGIPSFSAFHYLWKVDGADLGDQPTVAWRAEKAGPAHFTVETWAEGDGATWRGRAERTVEVKTALDIAVDEKLSRWVRLSKGVLEQLEEFKNLPPDEQDALRWSLEELGKLAIQSQASRAKGDADLPPAERRAKETGEVVDNLVNAMRYDPFILNAVARAMRAQLPGGDDLNRRVPPVTLQDEVTGAIEKWKNATTITTLLWSTTGFISTCCRSCIGASRRR
jgi:hypothetical protein